MSEAIRTLIVEDDPVNAELVREMLGEGGESLRFVAETFERLGPALERLARGGLDVVLLDLMLPDSLGLETVDAVHKAFPRLPIVVMTGLSDEETALKALRRGAQDFLVKGEFDPGLLRRSIRYARERLRLRAGLEGVIEGSADAMLVVVDGRVSYANPAAEALFGRGAGQMLGEAFELPAPPRARAELRLPTSGGGTRDVELRVTDVPWEEGSARLASLRDVTRLKRLERTRAEIAERGKTRRLREQFVYKVSHEIRSPLTVIKGAISNLSEGLAGRLNSAQAEAVRMADRNLDRVLRIIGSLLDLARLESGRAALEPRRTDPLRLLREAAEDFRVAHRRSPVVLEAEFPESLPTVYADPDMLLQVVVNILENAARFARGRIKLRARGADAQDGSSKELRVRVEDDGPGISPERALTVFDKYVQLDRRPERSGYRGTGLGLAICREIVELHGGRIWAESAPGQGGCFEFSVPVGGREGVEAGR